MRKLLLLLVTTLPYMSACVGNLSAPGTRGSTSTGGTTGGPVGSPNVIPFEPVAPATYVAKVKGLLTGQAPDPNEVAAVVNDANQMPALVSSWLNAPQAQNILTTFFTTAFQQKNLSPTAFGDQLAGLSCGGWWILQHENNFIGRGNDTYNVNARYVQEFTESFGRTVWQLAMVENQPFTSVLTTRRFMMTSTMVSTLLYFDRYRVHLPYVTSSSGIQIGGCGDWYRDVYANMYGDEVFNSWQVNSGGNIPIADTLNPNSSNFMHWYVQGTPVPPNNDPPIVFPVQQAATDAIYLMLNGLAYSENPQFFVMLTQPQWADSDFTDWRMVSVSQANPNDKPMRFWDIPAVRSLNQMPLVTPRVGFFTTPAFYANWLTNTSNSFRVTANQTLVVALGQSLLDADVVVRSANNGADENGSDQAHLSNPACNSCHVTLDPLRRFWAQAYDPTYEDPLDPNVATQYGTFLLDGANQSGTSLDAFGQILAANPAFPVAWVNKICQWANSAPCNTSDPEFTRIVTNFTASNFNFRAMLVDLLSSPLITGSRATQTWQTSGEPLSISRYDHFCTNMSQRLGLPNACNVDAVAAQNASNVPIDNYTRGSSAAYLPTQPSLFFRTAVENLCGEIAGQVVDPNGATAPPLYSSQQAPAALASMLSSVMAILPSDPRYNDLLNALTQHYQGALSQGASPTDALRSTFVVACISPSSIGLGL